MFIRTDGNLVVQILLRNDQNQAEVDAKNIFGDTALHWSVGSGQLVVSDTLIKNGANIHERNNDGFTPLIKASAAGKLISLMIQEKLYKNLL